MMLVAFGSSAASAHTAAKSKGTIAFLLSGPDLYYKYGSDGAKAAAKRLGYSLKIYQNATTSAQVETTNVQDAVAAKSVAITGYSVSFGTETNSIAYAAAHHVPVFFMYGYDHSFLTNKDVVGFEQVNLAKYSQPDGKYVKAHVKSGQVAVITGHLGRGDAETYQQGFLQGLGCANVAVFPKLQHFPVKCGKLTVVTSESGNWISSGTPGNPGGKEAAQQIIAAYPKLKALYVENEEMWLGVKDALTADGKMKQVKQVSTNGAPYGLAGIKAGQLAASDTDSPFQESLYAVRWIDNFLHHHGPGDKLYYSKTVFVTKKTVGKAVGWNPGKAEVNKLLSGPLPKPVKNPPM
jgi:ABC-type sugar transport system substrate-binding protein